MENTLENKIVFMAQYYGQQVVSNEYLAKLGVKTFVNDKSMLIDNFLELTPLHLITDEDARKIVYPILDNSIKKNYDSAKEFIELFKVIGFLTSYEADKVREMGCAYDFNGLSVSEQVERGWAVLKTKI